jgi:hypothetical protein
MKPTLSSILLIAILAALALVGYQLLNLRVLVQSRTLLPNSGQSQSLELGNIVANGEVLCTTDAQKKDCTPEEQNSTPSQ